MARDEAVPLVHDTGQPGALLLAGEGRALPILTDPHDADVVRRAAADLAHDIATVSGVKPVVRSGGPRGAMPWSSARWATTAPSMAWWRAAACLSPAWPGRGKASSSPRSITLAGRGPSAGGRGQRPARHGLWGL
jgi:hypothetical protein